MTTAEKITAYMKIRQTKGDNLEEIKEAAAEIAVYEQGITDSITTFPDGSKLYLFEDSYSAH